MRCTYDAMHGDRGLKQGGCDLDTCVNHMAGGCQLVLCPCRHVETCSMHYLAVLQTCGCALVGAIRHGAHGLMFGLQTIGFPVDMLYDNSQFLSGECMGN